MNSERRPWPADAASAQSQHRHAPALTSHPRAEPGDGDRATAVEARLQWSSQQLLRGRQEIEIAHGGSIYRLRLTSLGKLILTK